MDGAPPAERGVPEEISAILSHAAEQSGVPRVTLRDRALYAVDELTGLVTAVALYARRRTSASVTVKSIMKKRLTAPSPPG